MRTVFEILGPPQAHFEVRRCRVQKKHRSDGSDIYSRVEASAAAIIKKLLLTSSRIIEQRPSIDDQETTDQDEIRRTSQQDHRGATRRDSEDITVGSSRKDQTRLARRTSQQDHRTATRNSEHSAWSRKEKLALQKIIF